MKNLLRLLVLVLLSFTLVGCFGSSKVPSVNKKHEVELTSEQVIEKLELIEQEQQSGKVEFDVNVIVREETEAHIKLKGTLIVDETEKIYAKLDVDIQVDGVEVKGKGTFYIEDMVLYMDLDVAVFSSEGSISMDFEIKGKYKQELVSNDLDDFGFDIGNIFDEIPELDLSEILNDPSFKETLGELMEFTGLKFYQNGNELRIQLLVDKDIVAENEEFLTNNFLDQFAEEFTANPKNKIEMVVVIKNNVITEAGMAAKVFSDLVDIDASLSFKNKAKMPTFPSFDEYVDFDLEDIMFGDLFG